MIGDFTNEPYCGVRNRNLVITNKVDTCCKFFPDAYTKSSIAYVEIRLNDNCLVEQY